MHLYTMNGDDWTARYPRIVKEAARLREPLIIDAEVVRLLPDGVTDFELCRAAHPMRKPSRWHLTYFSVVRTFAVIR
jgi:ATP-dependent DNA ligase